MHDATLPVPIANHEAVTNLYGRWPAFHDAEVLSLRIDSGRGLLPRLELVLIAFETSDQTDSSGVYVTRNQAQITLQFEDVRELVGVASGARSTGDHRTPNLDDVMPRKVLVGLELTHDAGDRNRIHVVLDASVGLGATFSCASMRVVDLSLLA